MCLKIEPNSLFFWHNNGILVVDCNSLPIVVNYDRLLVLTISNNFKKFRFENFLNQN